MRVVHIITRFIQGGADENTLLCCNDQVRRGYDVHLVYGDERDEAMLSRLEPGVSRHLLVPLRRPVHPARDLLALWRCSRLLAGLRPDVVHTHTSKAGIIGRVAARTAGVPIIIHGVHILPFVNVSAVIGWLYRVLERWVGRYTDAFVSVGEEMRRSCLAAGIGVPQRHHVIPSAMEVARFIQARDRAEDWRTVLSGHCVTGANPRFVIIASRLERRKGQRRFLPVFAQLAHAFPDVVLLLAGDGPEREALEKEIVALGLAGRVVLTGFRRDIERLIAISEVGVLTSMREGLPRVVVQYALLARPIVATDIPGIRDVVDPGVTGYLVPAERLSEMVAPLTALLGDRRRWAQMSEANRHRDFSAWQEEKMVAAFDALYRDLARAKGLSP